MNPISDIHVVLVRPLYSRNVGYVSRVMANMGAQKLILVDSQCEYNLEARQGAAGAQSHLVQAIHYKTVDDFLKNEPEGIRIAFSARTKKETDPLPAKARANQVLASNRADRKPIYLIFGSEDHGLTNDDIEYAHFVSLLPIYGPFTSINLSHAVNLALYIFRDAEAMMMTTDLSQPNSSIGATAEVSSGFNFPKLALNQWLSTLGFETGDRRTDAYKVLKRVLMSQHATDKELRVLEAIVNQTVRKLGGNLREEIRPSAWTDSSREQSH